MQSLDQEKRRKGFPLRVDGGIRCSILISCDYSLVVNGGVASGVDGCFLPPGPRFHLLSSFVWNELNWKFRWGPFYIFLFVSLKICLQICSFCRCLIYRLFSVLLKYEPLKSFFNFKMFMSSSSFLHFDLRAVGIDQRLDGHY